MYVSDHQRVKAEPGCMLQSVYCTLYAQVTFTLAYIYMDWFLNYFLNFL